MDSDNQGRVCGLTRASSLVQTESCATQAQLIQSACKSMGLPEPRILEEPPGTSGYKTKFADRPMGLWCLLNLRKGDTLVALRLDRMGRNMMDCFHTIDTLFNRGVRIVIIKGWSSSIIDLRDPTSRLLLAILSWVSEEEARKTAERTKEGLAFRRSQGLACVANDFLHHIQCYDQAGKEISKGEFSALKGDFKRNLPDRQWLDHVSASCSCCRRRSGSAAMRARAAYCEDARGFVDRRATRRAGGRSTTASQPAARASPTATPCSSS